MINIRLLTPEDERPYANMWRKALAEQADFFRIALEDNPEQNIPTKYMSNSFTLGVFDNNTLCGSVSVEQDNRVKFHHKALLFKMFVHSDLAGKGIGRELMIQAISAAQKIEGLRQIYLTVLSTNHRAHHLYYSLGFVEFAHEPEAVKINNTYVEEIQMVYFLDKVK